MPADDAFLPLPAALPGCPLCQGHGGIPVWQDAAWRVIRADDADFPATYRVVARHHVREFSELLAPERQRCMDIVCAIERVLIEQLQPTKLNLAALGNVVAHLHWHVIARFDWDSRFPQAVWAERQRDPDPRPAARLGIGLDTLDAEVRRALQSP